ncbi:MAG: hypothetical protein LOD84_03220, partial [Limnochordales bacterium]
MAQAAPNAEFPIAGQPTLAFTIVGEPASEGTRRLLAGLRGRLEARGHEYRETPDEGVGLVINVFAADKPRSFRRRSQAVFVLGVTEVREKPSQVLPAAYPLLIRSLSNLLLYVVNDGQRVEPHFVTLEQGAYSVSGDLPEAELYEALYQRVAPLASSRLVINNIFEPDLPEELWEGDELTAQLRWAGQELDKLNLLPAPFPIQELLSEDEWRHV